MPGRKLNPNYQVVEVSARLLQWKVYWLSGWTKISVSEFTVVFLKCCSAKFCSIYVYACTK